MENLRSFIEETNDTRSALERTRPGIVERAQNAVNEKSQAEDIAERIATLEAIKKVLQEQHREPLNKPKRRTANDRDL
jgi:hypothetical protein